MNTVQVKNTVIGEGRPKICVPIVGRTKTDILEEAKKITTLPVDVVEWRVDWFDDVFATEKVLETAKELQEVLKDIPVLLTFRTSKEGGEKEISVSDYAALNIAAAQSGYVNLIDVEAFTAHTTNPVPFILVNYDDAYTLREGGCLADIAPTLIEIMGLEQPREMTGKSLLVRR